MKQSLIFLLLIFIFTFPAHADFGFAIGTGYTTKYETRQDAENGKDLVDFGGSSAGLGFEFEWLRDERLSINLSGVYRREDALTQYNKNENFVPNLDTTASTFAIAIGPRFRFVNWNHLRLFIGGGLGTGYLSLDYNNSDYSATNGSNEGLRDEGHAFGGYYYEAGVEFYLTQRTALRALGRHTTYQTKKFETVGDKNLNVDLTQFLLQFMFFI